LEAAGFVLVDNFERIRALWLGSFGFVVVFEKCWYLSMRNGSFVFVDRSGAVHKMEVEMECWPSSLVRHGWEPGNSGLRLGGNDNNAYE
jgi:hypothetical protein